MSTTFNEDFGGTQTPTTVVKQTATNTAVSRATGRAQGIVKRLDGALNKTRGFDRTVYKRTVVSTGGDPLTGRAGTITETDTLLNPQPFVVNLGRDRVPGDHAYSMTYRNGATSTTVADDYEMLVSPSVISEDELNTAGLCFVFKDTAGNTEVVKLLNFQKAVYQGNDCMFTCYCRSMTRPSGA